VLWESNSILDCLLFAIGLERGHGSLKKFAHQVQIVELDVSAFGNSTNEAKCPVGSVGEPQFGVDGGVLTKLSVGVR
jgi:hypothetical protein